jgi:predicted DNA-binding ribbon-helix-helix protein
MHAACQPYIAGEGERVGGGGGGGGCRGEGAVRGAQSPCWYATARGRWWWSQRCSWYDDHSLATQPTPKRSLVCEAYVEHRAPVRQPRRRSHHARGRALHARRRERLLTHHTHTHALTLRETVLARELVVALHDERHEGLDLAEVVRVVCVRGVRACVRGALKRR